jgi:transposase
LALPPYSPELNPVERIWHYLRSHWRANSVFRVKNGKPNQTAAADFRALVSSASRLVLIIFGEPGIGSRTGRSTRQH